VRDRDHGRRGRGTVWRDWVEGRGRERAGTVRRGIDGEISPPRSFLTVSAYAWLRFVLWPES